MIVLLVVITCPATFSWKQCFDWSQSVKALFMFFLMFSTTEVNQLTKLSCNLAPLFGYDDNVN